MFFFYSILINYSIFIHNEKVLIFLNKILFKFRTLTYWATQKIKNVNLINCWKFYFLFFSGKVILINFYTGFFGVPYLATFILFLFNVCNSLHPSSIRKDLKPRPLDHESNALTTRQTMASRLIDKLLSPKNRFNSTRAHCKRLHCPQWFRHFQFYSPSTYHHKYNWWISMWWFPHFTKLRHHRRSF